MMMNHVDMLHLHHVQYLTSILSPHPDVHRFFLKKCFFLCVMALIQCLCVCVIELTQNGMVLSLFSHLWWNCRVWSFVWLIIRKGAAPSWYSENLIVAECSDRFTSTMIPPTCRKKIIVQGFNKCSEATVSIYTWTLTFITDRNSAPCNKLSYVLIHLCSTYRVVQMQQ